MTRWEKSCEENDTWILKNNQGKEIARVFKNNAYDPEAYGYWIELFHRGESAFWWRNRSTIMKEVESEILEIYDTFSLSSEDIEEMHRRAEHD